MKLPAALDLLSSFGVHDPKTWSVYARNLRASGHISPTKRGHGSSHVTASDLAALVIAASVTASPIKASSAVNRYWKLPLDMDDERLPKGMRFTQQVLRAKTFGTAMTIMMENGPSIEAEFQTYNRAKATELLRHKKIEPADAETFVRTNLSLDLTIGVQVPIAHLVLGEVSPHVDDADAPLLSRSVIWRQPFGGRPARDRGGWSQTTALTGKALFAMASAITGDPE